MAKILLAEDEVNISSFIERGLQEFGHSVTAVFDGDTAYERIKRESFDLLILDVIMPGMNRTPVVILTALGTTDDIVSGLDAGADDYIVKPFSFQELVARVKALLRRGGESPSKQLICQDLVLDYDARQAYRGGKNIDLTLREFRLLEYFMTHQKVALSRHTLLKDVWDKESERNTNVVDVYVNYLRNKIDKDFDKKLIHTVTGMGYSME